MSVPFDCSPLIALSPLIAPGGFYVAGSATNGNGDLDFLLARFESDGTLDGTFGSAGVVLADFNGEDDVIRSIAVQSDGKIVAAGEADDGTGTLNMALARYNADGSLDTSFDSDGTTTLAIGSDAVANAVAVQGDGRIVVGGSSTPSSTGRDTTAVRFNVNGSLGHASPDQHQSELPQAGGHAQTPPRPG